MNNILTFKQKSFTLIVVAALSIFNSGCKKDEEDNKETIVDNPNVEYLDIADKVIDIDDNFYEKLDIDNDGENDFGVEALESNEIDFKETYTGFTTTYLPDNRVGAKEVVVKDGYTVTLVNEATFGQNVKALNFDYEGYTYISYKSIGTDLNFSDGIQGKGDKYVGIRFYIGDKLHFGWIKVNVNANGSSVTIKEWAYNKVAGESLNVGDR